MAGRSNAGRPSCSPPAPRVDAELPEELDRAARQYGTSRGGLFFDKHSLSPAQSSSMRHLAREAMAGEERRHLAREAMGLVKHAPSPKASNVRQRIHYQEGLTEALSALYDGGTAAGGGEDGTSSGVAAAPWTRPAPTDWFDEVLAKQKADRQKRLAARAAKKSAERPDWQKEEELFSSETQRYRDSVLFMVDVVNAGRPLRRHERPRADEAADARAAADPLTVEVGPTATRVEDTGLAGWSQKNLPASSSRRPRSASPQSLRSHERDFMKPKLSSAPPPPIVERTEAGTDTRFFRFGAILHAIGTGALRPLRGSYVLMLWRTGERIRRRTELPESAFWSLEEVNGLLRSCVASLGPERGAASFGTLLVALSYRWAADADADEDGTNLSNYVGPMAETYLFGEVRSLHRKLKGVGRGAKPDFCLFWDVACVHSAPFESRVEESLSAEGRRASFIWYGHSLTVTWLQPVLPPHAEASGRIYGGSAWTFCEAAASEVLKPRRRRLDISRHPGTRPEKKWLLDPDAWTQIYRAHVLPECMAPRRPPLMPAAVAAALRGHKSCAVEDDRELLAELYSDFFASVTRMVPQLSFAGLGWGASEMRALSRFVALCSRCVSIDLSGNSLGAEGGRAVAAIVSRQGCNIRRVNLKRTAVDAETVESLLRCQRVKAIELSVLPIYSTSEIARLKLQHGQMQNQPRLLLDHGAAEERVWAIREGERIANRAHDVRRAAHRHGWDDGVGRDFDLDNPPPVMASHSVAPRRPQAREVEWEDVSEEAACIGRQSVRRL
jgi:hypothetical protein